MRCCRAPFPAVRSVRVDPVEHPGAHAPDLTQALRYAPLSSCPPVAGHVEEPVAHEGVEVDSAAFCRAARWARLQRVQRLEWVGRSKRVLVWAISSCVSGHQSGRCERTHAKTHGGGGCPPEEHVAAAAASWGVWRTAAA